MVKKITEKIKIIAIECLKSNPDGLRYSKLVRSICEFDNRLNTNTINGCIWNLDSIYPDLVYKPSRGLFRLLEFKDPVTDELKKEVQPKEIKKISEEHFYSSFSNWWKNDLEDVTHSIPLGKKRFQDKWGTPDVIGKKESQRSDIIQGQTEIVSSEIKTATTQLITAFGQACSYKLFSHKSYLVVPKQSSQDEIARLDSLCQLFGIGLVLFDASSSESPEYMIRVRPVKHEPDLFYTNKYMKKIEKELFS